MKTAVVGGGCFWCIEAAFKEIDGVETVTPGYAGGDVENPTYREVCSGDTGHAEVVKVEYDQEEITYDRILDVFFSIHDPTTRDRQGPDVGSQYRSIILYKNSEQKKAAERKIEQLQREYDDEIVTELSRLEEFYPAEEKHQDYFEKNPDEAYCRMHVKPKVEKARELG